MKQYNFKVIEVSESDQRELGTNFLTLKENHIVVASGVSEDYKRKMRNNSVKVDYIDVLNLKKGMGSCHCMTQVICRHRTLKANL